MDSVQHGDVDGRLTKRLDLEKLFLQIREADFHSISIDNFSGENFVKTDFKNIAVFAPTGQVG